MDTEGIPTKKNQLIKNGICVGYMVDRLNGRRLGMEPNGVSRRQSYKYEPTSRMSNTYIAAGKDDPEQIIKDTKLGIYVADFGGGSVEPMTGDFNFSASEAYVIRDGKIAEMLKGCTLIGNGRDVLMNIDRVGNDLALGNGMCGAASGSVPVDVGQPTIRLSKITVGGRGGKLE
jgi:TldD protein